MKARLIFKDGSSRLVDDIETVEMVKERVHIGFVSAKTRRITLYHMQILKTLTYNASPYNQGRRYLQQLIDGGYIEETANVRTRTDKGERLLRAIYTELNKTLEEKTEEIIERAES